MRWGNLEIGEELAGLLAIVALLIVVSVCGFKAISMDKTQCGCKCCGMQTALDLAEKRP